MMQQVLPEPTKNKLLSADNDQGVDMIGRGNEDAQIPRMTESHMLPYNRWKISVVVPALNEAENLPHVLPRIPPWVHEVLLVDGASTDGTTEVAQRLRHDIRIVQQEGRGKGAALRSGFAAATGDIIVMLDADGSTSPEEIPAFVGALLAGADFAKGSRFLQGGGTADMPLHRQFGNWGFVVCVRMLFGGKYSDLCYGYNAFWRHILPQLNLDCDGFEIETMMNIRALRAELKIAEVPSFEAARVHGVGRLRTIPDGWRVLKTLMREWLRPPALVALPEPAKLLTLEVASQSTLVVIDTTNGKALVEVERTVGDAL